MVSLASQRDVLRPEHVHAVRGFGIPFTPINIGERRSVYHDLRTELSDEVLHLPEISDVMLGQVQEQQVISAQCGLQGAP